MEAVQAAAPVLRGKKHKPGDGFSANNLFPGEEESEIETEQISAVDYGYGEEEEREDYVEESNEQQDILVEDDLNNNRLEYKSGVQEWPDGSFYRGEFSFDLKLGYGEFAWDNGERYIGQFYKDHRHGKGVYFWPNGSRFTGSFYLNRKEGYGTMKFMDGKQFQGLYKADERFGPGIETYPDNRQDVGLWHRNHIIKLCTEVPEHFTLFDFPELNIYFDVVSKEQYISEESISIWDLNEEKDPFFYRFKHLILNDDNYTLPANMYIYSVDADNLPLTQSFLKEFDFQYFKKRKHHSSEKPWCITNITPILVKMQKNIYKYRHCQSDIDWDINAIIKGNRYGFGAKGPKELIAEELIEKSAEGDYKRVHEILKDNLAHPDIADMSGYTALSAAALNYQEDIINLLLDCGADVNKCNDEGLSTLSMCVIHYFPAEGFQPNIAERNIFLKELEDVLEEMSKSSLPLSRSEISQLSEASSIASSPVSVEELSLSVEKTEFVPDVGIKSSEETDNGEKSSGTICGVYNYKMKISPETMHQGAVVLSQHMLETHSYPDTGDSVHQEGTLIRMAASLTEQKRRMSIIKLLVRRGADPNISNIPMHVLFFAVKSADAEGVRILLEAGARTDIRLPTKLAGVAPLHIAAALPGVEGILITELLLHAAADPDVRAEDENDIFRLDKIATKYDIGESVSSMKMNNETGPPKGYYRECTIIPEEGGRTPLHIACEREDNFMNTGKVIHLLLDHNANPNVLWSGHSPLSLAVAGGNEQAVAELLAGGAEPNLPLSQSIASALCAVVNPAYEQSGTIAAKMAQIDSLLAAGADMLLPITLIDEGRTAVGTVVDYAYFKYYQDKRVLHTPLHSLSPIERDTYAFRRKMLDFLSDRLRECVSEKEKQWDEEEFRKIKIASAGVRRKSINTSLGPLPEIDSSKSLFFKYCYQCGRSVGVTLSPCQHCFEIFTCSKSCKVKAWNERHKRECLQTVRQRKASIKTKVSVQYLKTKDTKAKKQAAARHKKEEMEKWKHDRRRRTLVQASSRADLPYTGNYSFI
ncbi:ankyrin repeat and MYND domain-containing protein 1 isoform X2 [Pantherophis guttatus]|uniref:Ankyrin repeat and MYND domain-containing protein 1 isoform X2 n=1 Tax=Pantherophis guttatus TaxID=94885 RepID=A0A6P9DSG0_PANGU|nr:ankyrin repeat and MYND domain-containing protein 1 isoform X2 [Pantherophis guttatus]